MARYYEWKVGSIAYCFEKCEETVFIDAWLKIRDRIPAAQNSFKIGLQDIFFTQGKGVAAGYVHQMNLHSRRLGHEELEFQQTEVFDYGRNPDYGMKADHRQTVLADLEAASPNLRQSIVAAAQTEMDDLPPPHRTWEEFKARKASYIDDSAASRERVRRAYALAEANRPNPKPALTTDTAKIMLVATSNPDIQDRILAKLSNEDVLALIEVVPDQALKDRLIECSLSRI